MKKFFYQILNNTLFKKEFEEELQQSMNESSHFLLTPNEIKKGWQIKRVDGVWLKMLPARNPRA